MTTLTDDEMYARSLLLARLTEAPECMEAEFQVYNRAVSAAYQRVTRETDAYNAVLAEAAAFCESVATARDDYEGPRPYEAERVRDLGETWRAGGEEIGELTAGVDPPRVTWSFVNDGESDPADVLRDLPIEA